jgi:hypothetical protein
VADDRHSRVRVQFGQSVDHPMCPKLEGWTRAIALHSGALIEPKKVPTFPPSCSLSLSSTSSC